MLRPDSNQLPRWLEIIANLDDRLDEARRNDWLGEIEGIETSIAAAGHKLD